MFKFFRSYRLNPIFFIGFITNFSVLYSVYGQNGNPAPGEEVMFDVTWGDDSGSQSESYTLGIPMAASSTS
jgi:hypothetical protein